MAATEPASGRNTVSVRTGLPGSLAQPPPHGPFRDREPRRGQPPMGGCPIPAAAQLAEPLAAARRRSGSARGTRHPARQQIPSGSPPMRFTTVIGTARTDLSAADSRAPGHRQERGRSRADTHNLGGWFTAAAAAGPARPGAGRAPGRARSAAAAVRVTGGHHGGDGGLAGRDVPLQRGEPRPGCAAAAPGSGPCTGVHHQPGRPAGLPRRRGPGRADPGLIVEGFAPVRAGLGGQRRVRRAAEDRDLTQLRIPGFPAATAAGPGTP
jgi:hypothetical protein